MARISIATLDKGSPTSHADGFAGSGTILAVLDDARAPIHLHLHQLQDGDTLRIAPVGVDCTTYLWQGKLRARDSVLTAGSSLIVERGAALDVAASEDGTMLLVFTARQSAGALRAGGHVHLLPAENVPHYGDTNAGGRLHADASCATCTVWLHENSTPGQAEPPSQAVRAAGVHSHTEDEVIVVTRGQIRLGNRLYGPGTAIAIAANTFYGFTTGPEGLSFVNFRAGAPGEICFASGQSMNEIAYWQQQLDAPKPLTFAASRAF
jgi:quercetin dioxygenase-like cupin family protein